MATRRLLIIEDDLDLADQIRSSCSEGQVSLATSAREAEGLLRKEEPQVVTLNLGVPPEPSRSRANFDLLETINTLLPRTKVIVITRRDEQEYGIQAVARGVHDYLVKPLDSQALSFALDRAFRLWELESKIHHPRERQGDLAGLVMTSPAMQSIAQQMIRVAPTDAPVHIIGDTGTGKEAVARALHSLSARRHGPFIIEYCAAVSEQQLDSELFGRRGEPNGETSAGKLETADGGTLLLDDLDALPLSLQTRLLRFLQDGRLPDHNGSQRRVDVRVLSASTANSDGVADNAGVRKDLYFRLSEVTLKLPPLRQRQNDIVLLGKMFVERYGASRGLQLSRDCMSAMEAWQWPGNVRELDNRIKRACLMAEGRFLTPKDLEIAPAEQEVPLNLKEVRAEAERQAILRALNRCNDNVSQTARMLGISRPTLYNLFSKHGLAVESPND